MVVMEHGERVLRQIELEETLAVEQPVVDAWEQVGGEEGRLRPHALQSVGDRRAQKRRRQDQRVQRVCLGCVRVCIREGEKRGGGYM
eukprot:2920209-Pleurochrysis_carterae.AAC.5